MCARVDLLDFLPLKLWGQLFSLCVSSLIPYLRSREVYLLFFSLESLAVGRDSNEPPASICLQLCSRTPDARELNADRSSRSGLSVGFNCPTGGNQSWKTICFSFSQQTFPLVMVEKSTDGTSNIKTALSCWSVAVSLHSWQHAEYQETGAATSKLRHISFLVVTPVLLVRWHHVHNETEITKRRSHCTIKTDTQMKVVLQSSKVFHNASYRETKAGMSGSV